MYILYVFFSHPRTFVHVCCHEVEFHTFCTCTLMQAHVTLAPKYTSYTHLLSHMHTHFFALIHVCKYVCMCFLQMPTARTHVYFSHSLVRVFLFTFIYLWLYIVASVVNLSQQFPGTSTQVSSLSPTRLQACASIGVYGYVCICIYTCV